MCHYYLSVLRFILSDVNFCLFYKKVNHCKIRNNIIKTVISSDRKHFLVYTYVSKVLFMAFIPEKHAKNEI